MPGAEPSFPPETVRPSVGELARAFLLVGATSFGGGLTGYLRRALVEKRHWLTDDEFLGGLSVAQAVPGPNAVNLAVFVGYRMHGLAGSLLAVLSVFLFPVLALTILAAGWARWGSVAPVVGALGTLAAFGAALMAATGATMLRAARLRVADLLLAAVAFVSVALLRLPVPAVLLGIVPVSFWIHRRDETSREERG